MPDRHVISGDRQPEDIQFEAGLRPRRLADFTGQTKLKENLSIAIQAARMRGEAMDHVLLYGPPGLGKTTLASIIAEELEVNFSATSGPVLQKKLDLTGILSNIRAHQVFFIDEIHRLLPDVEEMLYSALEDFRVDILVGAGPGARTHSLPLPKFTGIGATTRQGLVSAPLRGRFGLVLRLDPYTVHELKSIVTRSARLLNAEIEDAAAEEIARRCRGTGAHRQPAATARARLRAGARRRPDYPAGGADRARSAGRGSLRARRNRPEDHDDDSGEVSRRAGRREYHRGLDRRGAGHHRRSLRAVPDSTGISEPHAARARSYGAGLRALQGEAQIPQWRAKHAVLTSDEDRISRARFQRREPRTASGNGPGKTGGAGFASAARLVDL